ncbi:MAG: PAS domain S-box protein [candidate division KSB1 bacterium]|nr:PAS domain S-box protein [candidate division KSB1 bacterium]
MDETIAMSRPQDEPRRYASPEGYRMMVEHAGQAIVVAQDGWLKFVNPKATEITGYSREELLSIPFLEFVHPEDRQRVADGYRRRILGQDPPSSYCFRIFARDGKIKWLELTGVRIDWEGKPATLNFLSDVTQRIEAEQRLRESEQRFRTLVEQSLVGVCIIGGDSISYANERFAEIFGFSREELQTERYGHVGVLVHPEDREQVRAAIRELLVGQRISSLLEFRGLRKDGEVVYLRAYGARAALSESPVVIATLVDVTGEQRALEALRSSEERFQMMMATTRDALYRLRFADRQYDYLSPGIEELTGYTPEEIAAIGFRSLVQRMEVVGSAPSSLSEIAHQMYSGQLKEWRALYQIRDKWGRLKWFRDHAFPWRDETGQIIGSVGILEDVTELREAEEALRESERRFRELFDEAPVGYHEIDREGRVVRVNRTELQLLGYRLEEMLGRPYWEFSADPEHCREYLLSALGGKQRRSKPVELILRKKDGSTLPALVELRVLRDGQEEILGLRCTVQDLSAIKKLQEQLMLAQRLETVGVLAGGVAHDFNNLLTVILGSTQLILAELPPESPIRRDLLEIQKAAERGASLTRQLLAFARKQIMRPRVMNLNDIVLGLEPMLRRLIGEDIQLELRLDPQLGPVRVDPTQIEQVIMNLAVNARDAMPNGGSLAIETQEVYLDEGYAQTHPPVKPGRYIALVVSDTGVGMDPEVQKHIFEPFFTTKEVGKGTGLGLSMVYGIVKQSGGYIWVYSEPGQGSTFKIYLPLAETEEAPERRPTEALPVCRDQKSVLLIEDDEKVRQLTRRAIARLGFRVLCAASGQEALELLRNRAEKIDLVVSDVIMPGLHGPELAEEIRKLRPEVKIIFMSGYPASTLQRQAKWNGQILLQKPFDLDELSRVLLSLSQEECPQA